MREISIFLQSQIEEIQKRFQEHFGIPEAVLERRYRESTDSLFSKRHGLHMADLPEEQLLKFIQSTWPEEILAPKRGGLLSYCDARYTKYDRMEFLQRFVNLEELCHSAMFKYANVDRKNIIVSSVASSSFGGLSIQTREHDGIVLLNEGCLSSIPMVYENILPLFDPADFGIASPEHFGRAVISIGSFYISGLVYDPKSTHSRINLPHAHERWRISQQILQSLSGRKEHHDGGFTGVNTRKKKLFYACRGAFIFLLAHEFAHIYRNHVSWRQSSRSLRNHDYFNQYYRNSIDRLREYGGSEADLMRYEFTNLQVTEEDADCFAYLTVLEYAKINKLQEDEDIVYALIVGALLIFVVEEIAQRLLMLKKFGEHDTALIMTIDPVIRNIMIESEHPSPMSRISLLAHHYNRIDGFDDITNSITAIYELMTTFVDNFWNIALLNIDRIGLADVPVMRVDQMEWGPLLNPKFCTGLLGSNYKSMEKYRQNLG